MNRQASWLLWHYTDFQNGLFLRGDKITENSLASLHLTEAVASQPALDILCQQDTPSPPSIPNKAHVH